MQINLAKLRERLVQPDKSVEDLRRIYEIFSATPLQTNFFRQILKMGNSERYILEICKGFKYKFYSKGTVIFEQGDINTDNLYIIIKGVVGIYIEQSSPSLKPIAIEKTKTPMKNSEQFKEQFLDSRNVQKRPLRPNSNIPKPELKKREGSVKQESIKIARIRASVMANRRSGAKLQMTFGPSCLKIPTANKLDSMKSLSAQSLIFHQTSIPRMNQPSIIEFLDHVEIPYSATGRPFLLSDHAIQSLFCPKNKEQLMRLKSFELKYLNDQTQINDEELTDLKNRYGKKVRELRDWAIFGELSREISQPRTATTIALTNTEIIQINQTNYQDMIKIALKFKKTRMMDFVCQTLKIAKTPSNIQVILTILPSIEKIQINKGEAFIMQGDPIEYFYLIKKGEVKLSKIIKEEPQSIFYEGMDPKHVREVVDKLSGEIVSIGVCGSEDFLGEEFLFSKNLEQEIVAECASLKVTLLKFRIKFLNNLSNRLVESMKKIYDRKKQLRIANFQRNIELQMNIQRTALPSNFLFKQQVKNHTYLDPMDDGPTQNMCSLSRFKLVSENMKLLFSRVQSLKKYNSRDKIVDFTNLEGHVKRSTSHQTSKTMQAHPLKQRVNILTMLRKCKLHTISPPESESKSILKKHKSDRFVPAALRL